jgi:hypothetical protein
VLAWAQAGIAGYIPNTASIEDLITLVEEIGRGEQTCPSHIAGSLLISGHVLTYICCATRTSHSYKFGVSTACNAPASNPRLVTSEVYAMVTVSAGCRKRKFVLSLIGSDDLIANSAALPFTVICPHLRGEARGQLPGPNLFPGTCQNLRESHRHLPWGNMTVIRTRVETRHRGRPCGN